MTQDRPLLGIALMLGFCIIAPMGDAVAKMLGNAIPLTEVVLIRFALQVAVLVPLVYISGLVWRFERRIMGLILVRTVLHVLGIAAMFTALRYLPLADAVAIVFVMPFFLLVLGHVVLGEHVGMRRLLASAVGFVGVLMVVQPSFATVGLPALLPLFVAASFSVFILITRQIAKDTDPISLQAVSGVMAVILMAPLLLIGSVTDAPLLALVAPTASQWMLLLALGLFGTLAHLLMTWSLRFAPSATVAPMQYLEIPIAAVIGLIIFGELPNALAAVGMAVTVIAGVYIILRERAMAQAAPPAALGTPAE